MQSAELYHHDQETDVVICDLCRQACRIKPGKRGLCGVRLNDGGELKSLVYGRPVSLNPDPIEKKPLFHFLPGSRSMSLGTVGCNFKCDFCQNCDISQYMLSHSSPPPSRYVAPDEVVELAKRSGCQSISYTYNEPTVFLEYAEAIGLQAKAEGLGNCFVSNGFMTRDVIERISPWLDAINVDLKCFSDETYRRIIGGRLEGVLDSIRLLKELGVWVELTTLMVPEMNDSEGEISQIAEFIARVDPSIPWHVSRFHPQYKMLDRPPTGGPIVMRALEAGREAGLHHVYCGNLRDRDGESTRCSSCGCTLIERSGFTLLSNNLTAEKKCPKCDTPVRGVWTLGV